MASSSFYGNEPVIYDEAPNQPAAPLNPASTKAPSSFFKSGTVYQNVPGIEDALDEAEASAAAAANSAQVALGHANTATTQAGNAASSAAEALAAQLAAEAAQGLAEDAQEAAEVAQGLAENAQSAAEFAQGLAETAQLAAEAAQGLAEDAQAAAELAESNAAQSASDAQNSADASELSRQAADDAAEDAALFAQTLEDLYENTVHSWNGRTQNVVPEAGDYAVADITGLTAALAAKADSSSLATVATSGSYTDLSDTPTLGTAAAQDTTAFASAAQGELADTAVQPDDLGALALKDAAEISDVTGLQDALNDKSDANHTHALDDLSDVDTSGASNGQALVFDGSEWKAGTVSAGSAAAEDVTYDNTASGLTADDAQEALDELAQRVVQTQINAYTNYVTLTATIPLDDTIPQQTEGTELAVVNITPKYATSRLRVRAACPVFSNAGYSATMGVFRDSGANAIAANFQAISSSAALVLQTEAIVSAGSTSTTSFKMRVGPTSGSIYVNGNVANRLLGGTSRAYLIVDEIL